MIQEGCLYQGLGRERTALGTIGLLVFLFANCGISRESATGEQAAVNKKQNISVGKASEVGMSEDGLFQALSVMREAVEEGKVTGAQLIVARNSRVVLHEALGFRDLERQLPMDSTSLIRMASNTKSIVATGILMLAEDGELSLRDPVSKYIPDFNEGLSSKLTIHDLLCHTTGFDNQLDNFAGEVTTESEEFPGAPSLRVEAIKIGRVGPAKKPGGVFRYNNWGYTVLGAILEQVSGQKIDKFLQKRMYNPLGMTESSHALYGIDPKRVSLNYTKTAKGWETIPPDSPPFVRSTGGLVTTAWDFAKFCQLYLDRGVVSGRELLNSETIQIATSVQSEGPYQYIWPERAKERGLNVDWYSYRDSRGLDLDVGYGYGWAIARNGAYSHGGFRGTFALVDPNERLIILILAQSREGGTPGQEFIDAVYDSVIN